VDGIMACTRKEFGYEIFNLGESQPVELNLLIDLLEVALKKTATIQRHLPQPGDVPHTCADISKARAKLGYDPQVKIEKGLPLFIDWFTWKTP
jgi:UDP-glucuronate 4-epimerase